MSTNFPPPKRREAWRKQENRLHKEGVKRVPGSGSGQDKGDNKGQEFLVQCKTTRSKQFALKLAEWEKTCEDAAKEDRMPVMQVQLQDRDKLAVLDWYNFVEILRQAGLAV
jgi:hypothetical protein